MRRSDPRHSLNNPCRCGSKEFPDEHLDGYGIFLFYGCSKCTPAKLRGYRPDILTTYETDEQIEDDY